MKGFFRRRGLRFRITIAFLGGALAVSALVAGTTYVLADRYLSERLVEDSTRQSLSSVRFATRYVAEAEADVSLSELVDFLEARGAFDVLVLAAEDEWLSSSVSITPSSVPARLRGAVGSDRVGYEFRRGEEQVVFGSPVPGQELFAFFFFPTQDVIATLTLLRQVLLGVSIGAVLLAAAVGTRVSRRVVNPVRRASRAARRVAEGLLETRLPSGGRDELGALAASFNEMAAALEERINRERRFVGDVSHELRTPLTTLRASTEYLLERTADLPISLRRATELLAADLQYLQRLVDDLLDLSRAEAGRIEMAWERVNLADLVGEVVNRRARSGGPNVRIQTNGDPEALSTVADKRRLERVVGNLLDNALEHGKGREVTIRLAADDGKLAISVEDRGPGIPAEERRRIFERFFKADPARRRGLGGSGLGLAIARENAHLHGGEIELDDGRDGGTRFTFRFPARGEP